MRLAIALGCAGLLSGSVAWADLPSPDDGAGPGAQEPQPPPPAVMVVQPPPPPQQTLLPPQPPRYANIDRGTLDDANAGRVAFMPTALTPPAGTWSFEDEELFLIGASYAVTDQLLISATTMIPVTSDFYWGYISAKLQVVKQGPLRVALQAGAFGIVGSNSNSTDSTGAFELSGALTYCINDDCSSHLDGAVAAAFAHQSDTSVPVGIMGGAVVKVSNHVRLVLEADTAHLFGELSGQANGFLGWYGLRFTSRQIAVDLELVKPFCGNGDCNSDTLPLGFPFVAFSYRGLE